MLVRRTLLCTGVLATCAVTAVPGDVTLVSDGRPLGTILLPATPSATEQFATDELQRYIAAATNATLPILKEPDAVTGPCVSVGRTNRAEALGYPRDESFCCLPEAHIGNIVM